ncbi:hypothetical protein UlMin_013618 [Ulmus minor]
MGGSNSDEKILSYNDVVLRREDLDILSGPNFLNDRIIEFYFSYLASSNPSDDILLVPPSISFWITNFPDKDSLKDFVEPLNLPDKRLVLFPVNDNNDVSVAAGGSHWSLLVYERKTNLFVHHDSNGGMNKWQARKLYNAVSYAATDAKYIDFTDSPQQVNGYDCGLYVTAIARVICLWYNEHKNDEQVEDNVEDYLWLSAVKEQVTPSAVARMRTEILELIRSLMAANSSGSGHL